LLTGCSSALPASS